MSYDSQPLKVRITDEMDINDGSPSSESSSEVICIFSFTFWDTSGAEICFILEAVCFTFTRVSHPLGAIPKSLISTSKYLRSLSPDNMSTPSTSDSAEQSDFSSTPTSESPFKWNWITFWSKACTATAVVRWLCCWCTFGFRDHLFMCHRGFGIRWYGCGSGSWMRRVESGGSHQIGQAGVLPFSGLSACLTMVTTGMVVEVGAEDSSTACALSFHSWSERKQLGGLHSHYNITHIVRNYSILSRKHNHNNYIHFQVALDLLKYLLEW